MLSIIATLMHRRIIARLQALSPTAATAVTADQRHRLEQIAPRDAAQGPETPATPRASESHSVHHVPRYEPVHAPRQSSGPSHEPSPALSHPDHAGHRAAPRGRFLDPPPPPIELTPSLACDETTDTEILWHIARHAPQLRRWLIANPNADAALLEYVAQASGPGVVEGFAVLFESIETDD